MNNLPKLVLGYIGNGKSTNRYHLPFSLNRPEKIKVKTVYQRTLVKGGWAPVDSITYTDNLDEMLTNPGA